MDASSARRFALLSALLLLASGCGTYDLNAHPLLVDEDGDGLWLAYDCDDSDPRVGACSVGDPCAFDEQCQTGGCAGGICVVSDATSGEGVRGYDVCTPNCANKECGGDGCGGVCGACPTNQSCAQDEESASCVTESELSPGHMGAVFKLSATPAVIQYNDVPVGTPKTKTVTLINEGSVDATVSELSLVGSDMFTAFVAMQEWRNSMGESLLLEPPLIIPAGTAKNLAVRFTPLNEAEAAATLKLQASGFVTNAEQKVELVLPIVANAKGPCISVNPKHISFGGKRLGQLATVEVDVLSCGESPLIISGLNLVDHSLGVPSSEDFGLELIGLTGLAGETHGSDAPPVVIAPNETRSFVVSFVPDEINKLNPSAEGVCVGRAAELCQTEHEPTIAVGEPIPDLGKIQIQSNAPVVTSEIDLHGFGVEVECPTAVIVVEEGEEVIPQTELHLSGAQSYAANGNISKYEWSVQQPVGSQSLLLPSSSVSEPSFQANVVGSYIFTLRVRDQNDQESCIPAHYKVFVASDAAIRVELLWHTPLDPNETDEGPEAGADLDLHFLHPFATGEDVNGDGAPDGWFDQPFDCFWFNPHPNWGSLDPAKDDDPGLDLDDTDGAGPENMNLNQPQDGMTYTVGVHYWNDHEFGETFATIRIYIYSWLTFQLSEVELKPFDMWEVAEIAWPGGAVIEMTDSQGAPRITPDYYHPFFPTPD